MTLTRKLKAVGNAIENPSNMVTRVEIPHFLDSDLNNENQVTE